MAKERWGGRQDMAALVAATVASELQYKVNRASAARFDWAMPLQVSGSTFAPANSALPRQVTARRPKGEQKKKLRQQRQSQQNYVRCQNDFPLYGQ